MQQRPQATRYDTWINAVMDRQTTVAHNTTPMMLDGSRTDIGIETTKTHKHKTRTQWYWK
jgi:hypothetical protein